MICCFVFIVVFSNGNLVVSAVGVLSEGIKLFELGYNPQLVDVGMVTKVAVDFGRGRTWKVPEDFDYNRPIVAQLVSAILKTV